ncbi:MAG: CAP domain-containing protein [Bacteroidales bacterium]
MKKLKGKFSVPVSLLVISLFICNPSTGQTVIKQGPAVPAGFCINRGEMELYRMINAYREQNNLPPIPLSKSLSKVAALHAKDLLINHPDQGSCNFHSWSNKGGWLPFCYPKDESKKNSVWDKPRELTRYPSRAYEIVYWENNPLVTDTIMMVWKTEDYFNSFLLNTGKWLGRPWNAIGIAVCENYACAWFGEVTDPDGEVFVCGTRPKVADTIKPIGKPIIPAPVKPKKPKAAKTVHVKADTLAENRNDSLHLKPVDSLSGTPPEINQSKDSITGTYYIIVKTNLALEAANKLVNQLISGDYPLARVLDKDGKIRVSAFESTNKTTVMAKLKEVKGTYKDAWLLKK